MAEVYKQLGQKRENSTNAVSVYSPSQGKQVIIKTIVIANTTAAAVTYRIFVDDDGTTYDETTALAFDIYLAANTSVEWVGAYTMNNENGNLAYRSSSANALTITVFGVEIS